MTKRTWKIVDMVGRINPAKEWTATLLSGDDILVTVSIEGDISKATAEEIVEQFIGKTEEV